MKDGRMTALRDTLYPGTLGGNFCRPTRDSVVESIAMDFCCFSFFHHIAVVFA